MSKKKKQASVKQLETTNKAYLLRHDAQNDDELAETLGLSKVTLYTRLKLSNWKKPEINFIDFLSKQDSIKNKTS